MADPRIIEYIRANELQYTDAGLREQLLAAGHAAADVDAALAEARSASSWSSSRKPMATGMFWLAWALGSVGLILAYLILPAAFGASAIVAAGIALLAGLLLAFVAPLKPPVRLGIGLGVATAFGAVMAYVLVVGILFGAVADCLSQPVWGRG